MTDRETADLRARRLRAAIANLDPETVKGTFRSLSPAVLAQLHPALRTSLGRLRSARDPLALLALPHFDLALEYVAQAVTMDCLDAVREALGAAADDPTLDQLRAALAQVSEKFTADIIAVLLAVTAVVDAPAAGVCDEVLASTPAYGLRIEDLPEEPAAAPGAAAAPAPGVPVARRSSAPRPAKGKKKGGRVTPSQKVHKPWKTGGGAGAGGSVGGAAAGRSGSGGGAGSGAGGSGHGEGGSRGEAGEAGDSAEPPAAARSPKVGDRGRGGGLAASERRPAHLTPKQEAEFDLDDAWAGAVVLAEIRYRSPHEEHAHFGAKERPCVVIAGNADTLLVRPGYTGRYQQENWRSVPLKKWHQAGLNQATWIEHDVHEVDRAHVSLLGRVADDDWNALW